MEARIPKTENCLARSSYRRDREMISSRRVVASSDGPLLDEADRWVNLARYLIEKRVDAPWVIDLS